MSELIIKEKKPLVKPRATKIDMYHLENKVLNYIAETRSYKYIAEKLMKYMHNRKQNPVEDFNITPYTIKSWWVSNYGACADLVNEKRAAILQQRYHRFIDKGTEVRDNVQEGMKKDAKNASAVAETSFDHEAVARIREKIIKVQESGEKSIEKHAPNINVTQINVVSPVDKFTKAMKKAGEDIDEEESKTIDVEFQDLPDDEDDDFDEEEEKDEDIDDDGSEDDDFED